MRGRHAMWVMLAAGGSLAADLPASSPPTSPPVANTGVTMREERIGETEVATFGKYRVALAKTWEEDRGGTRVKVAWLSVVEKGSTTGPTEPELTVGETLTLGTARYEVREIVLASGNTSGSVLLVGG